MLIYGGGVMSNRSGAASTSIVLYALQTCSHCKALKEWLTERRVAFRTVHVDMLVGAERNDTMRHLRRINPSISFPTLMVGDTTIVGFKKEEIRAALETLQAE
jgi:glutaredoxin-like protein NrdH